MDVFASYVDEDELRDDEEGEEEGGGAVEEAIQQQAEAAKSALPGLLEMSVDLTPSVAPILGLGAFAKAESREVTFNPKVETLYAAVQGPAALPPGVRRETVNNTPTGHVERTHLNHFLFDQQYHTFHNYGFAADPTISAHPQALVGNADNARSKGAATVFDSAPSARQRKKLAKQRRKESGDPGSEDYLGPWAPPVDEKAPKQLTADEVAEYEAWKPISKKKRKQMERQAMLAEEGEGDEEQQGEPEEKEKKKKKKKKKEKKNIETVFEDESAPAGGTANDDDDSDEDGDAAGQVARSAPAPGPSRVGPARPPAGASSAGGGDDDDDDDDEGSDS